MHRFRIILTFALFLAVSVLHLIACYRRYPKLRGSTKMFLMPLLCAFYLAYTHDIRLLVIAALLFGWIGDIFLLVKNNRSCMMLGICAFALGHISYIAAILSTYRTHPHVLHVLVTGLLCVIWMVFVCVKLLPYAPKSLKKPGFVYAFLLSVTCLSALYRFLSTSKGNYLIAFIGGLFFILSDTLLTGHQYRKELKHGNFYVMLTYIVAQTLLIIGLTQTGGIRIWNLLL